MIRRLVSRLLFPPLAAAAALVATCAGDAAPTSDPGNPVVIEIGTEEITLERFLLHLRQVGPHIDFARLPAAEQQRLAREYVERRLFATAARERGVDREPEVKARIDFFTDGVLAQSLKDRLLLGIPVAEEEIAAFYAEHRAEFTEPPRYLVEHLLYARRARAREARDRLRDGAGFAAVRDDAGPELLFSQRGWLTPELLLPAVAAATAGIAVGGTSEVVETSHGFHVLRLADLEAARPQELAEVRERIDERIRRRKASDLYRELLRELETARPVRLHLDRLPARER